MKFRLCLVLLSFPLLAHASVAEDISALLDQFFGGDQAPLEEVSTTPDPLPRPEPLPPTPEPVIKASVAELQREIVSREAELEAFEIELRQAEETLWTVGSEKVSSQRQLQLLDEQMGFNQRKLEHYRSQQAEWKALVEKLTREKSELRAQIRILERDYGELLNKKFIRKQNFELSPTISLWQWLFSDRPVSQILADRKQVGAQESNQRAALAQMEKLKKAYEAQEREAVEALATVSNLQNSVAKEQIILRDLADAKATLLARLEGKEDQVAAQLNEFRVAQAETTQYLQTLRRSLVEAPDEAVQTVLPLEPTSFVWPLAGAARRITATFKDADYQQRFGREHQGLDIASPQGSDVLAVAEGIVNKVATDGTGYTYIIVQHDPDLYTVYGHLSKTLVAEDDPVQAGQTIAWSGGAPGTAGAGYFSTGPHLHLEVFSGGQFVDPLRFLPNIE